MRLKINRKYFVDIQNIEKLVIKDNIVWVYRLKGYPKIYKSDCGIYLFRNRLVNLGLQLKDFKVEYGDENKMKVVHCKKEKFDIYIGRPGKWGNPFSIGKDGTREEVIQKYEIWIRNNPELLKDLHELKDKTLACWCSPQACHGDILIKLIGELNA